MPWNRRPRDRSVPFQIFTGKLRMPGRKRSVDRRHHGAHGSHPLHRPMNNQSGFCITESVQSFHTSRHRLVQQGALRPGRDPVPARQGTTLPGHKHWRPKATASATHITPHSEVGFPSTVPPRRRLASEQPVRQLPHGSCAEFSHLAGQTATSTHGRFKSSHSLRSPPRMAMISLAAVRI